MNHKIGDTVTIRKDLKVMERCGNDDFNEEMSSYSGRTAKIKNIGYLDYYELDIDKGRFAWTDEMFEAGEEKCICNEDIDEGCPVHGLKKTLETLTEGDRVISKNNCIREIIFVLKPGLYVTSIDWMSGCLTNQNKQAWLTLTSLQLKDLGYSVLCPKKTPKPSVRERMFKALENVGFLNEPLEVIDAIIEEFPELLTSKESK